MDNNISALQNLYVAMGGDIEDVEDLVIIPDMINAIATAFQGAAQFMLEPLIIGVTEDGGTYSADVAYSEILESYQHGKRLVVQMTIGDIEGYAELQGLMGTAFVFTADDYLNNLHYVVGIDSDESVTLGVYSLTSAV